jgi:uncharacterized coiled-coil DUF342 family protein
MSISFPNLSTDVFRHMVELKNENDELRKQIHDLTNELTKTNFKLETIHSLFNKIYKEWKNQESQFSKLSWLTNSDS